MTSKLCTFSGCNRVVNHSDDGSSPRCTQHVSNGPRKKYTHHFDQRGKNIYKTAMWKRCRKAQLMLQPFCEECEKYNIVKIAKIVDHIIEVEDGGELYDLNNLQSLCQAHHNTKTGYEKKKRNAPAKKYPSLSDF